jgi:hypothetical protein
MSDRLTVGNEGILEGCGGVRGRGRWRILDLEDDQVAVVGVADG